MAYRPVANPEYIDTRYAFFLASRIFSCARSRFAPSRYAFFFSVYVYGRHLDAAKRESPILVRDTDRR